jgi:cobalamin biosynthesis protein CbiD
VREANTARHAAEILQEHGANHLFDMLCDRAAQRCSEYVDGRMAVECLLVDFDGGLWGRSVAGE